MQNMLLCIINVVSPEMYNPKTQLHLFNVAEHCCLSPALHLKGSGNGHANFKIQNCSSKQIGHVGV